MRSGHGDPRVIAKLEHLAAEREGDTGQSLRYQKRMDQFSVVGQLEVWNSLRRVDSIQVGRGNC